MRLFGSLLVMVILLVGGGLWINHSLAVAAEELSHNVRQITEEVQKSDWHQANQHVKELEKDWNRIGSWWPVVLDHQEIDNIEFSLAKVKEYIASKNTVLSLGQLSELKLMILHLPEKEEINLKNIL